MAQAHFTTDYTLSNSTETNTVSMSYKDFTALEFTMFVSVTEWIWLVGLLTIVVSVQLTETFSLSPAAKTFINRGNVMSLLPGSTPACFKIQL
jgi:hypothetical protein